MDYISKQIWGTVDKEVLVNTFKDIMNYFEPITIGLQTKIQEAIAQYPSLHSIMANAVIQSQELQDLRKNLAINPELNSDLRKFVDFCSKLRDLPYEASRPLFE